MEYNKNDIVIGKINKIEEGKGVYVSLPEKRFGFIPLQEMRKWNKDGEFLLEIKQSITAVVIKDSGKGPVLLSLDELVKIEKKQRQERNLQFVEIYKKGDIFEAEVVKIGNKKVHIQIGEYEGIIPKDELNHNVIDSPDDVVFLGESLNVVFIGEENGKLIFSLKYLIEKPYEDDLYDLSQKDLLEMCGCRENRFIGKAKSYVNGKLTFIENLYEIGANKGHLLVDPYYGYNLRALVPNNNFIVEDDCFYKVELRLVPKERRMEKQQLFQFAAVNIEKCKNPYKEDVDLTFTKYTDPAANSALSKTLDEVGKNMYSSKERMFFELIQNADDAASKNGVIVNVNTEGDYLSISHNGYSFDKDDFEAITSSANGTKKANENKTGYKGIGFKSVFTDSEKVYIKTGLYQFKFDRTYPLFKNFIKYYKTVNEFNTQDQIDSFCSKYRSEIQHFEGVKSIPWQLKPIWIDSYPSEFNDKQLQSNVFIALKLGENKIIGQEGYNKTIESIIENPKFMLFLRNTRRITFNESTISKDVKGNCIILKNSFAQKKVELFERQDFVSSIDNDTFEERGIDIRISIEEEDKSTGKIIEAKFVDLHSQEIENIPKKIAINKSSAISFAIPFSNEKGIVPNVKCEDISLFAFLPTLVKDFKFPFYINANFILDPPRQRILGDNPWNFYLMSEIALKIVQWVSELCKRKEYNALNVLPKKYFDEESSADTNALARFFNESYKTALETECFILNQENKIVSQKDIILDKTGLGTDSNPCLSSILSAELFCKILGTDKLLPSNEIDSTILSAEIFENAEKIYPDDLKKRLTGNNDIKQWYLSANADKKEKFDKWLIENDCEEAIKHLPLFNFSDGWKTPNELDDNHIVLYEKFITLKEILVKLGFYCSLSIFEECPFKEYIELRSEVDLFDAIISKTSNCAITSDEKRLIITTTFVGVGDKTIQSVKLFNNMLGIATPLNEMLAYREDAPHWLMPYMICKEECAEEIKEYLISDEDEYNKVVLKHSLDISPIEQINYYKLEGQDIRDFIDTFNSIDDLLESCYYFDESFEIFLSIIEKADIKTKEFFLNKITRIDLSDRMSYTKTSYESRVLQLALNTLQKPSEFSYKVFYNGKCITEFSVKDDVICEYYENGNKKTVKMSLSKLLPQYKNQSDAIEKIKSLFDVMKDLDKFFDAKSKSIFDINDELNKNLNIPLSYFSQWRCCSGNAQQYLFATYYRRNVKGWNNAYVPKIALENESDDFVRELMNFLYDNNIAVTTSPFTYHIGLYFNHKSLKNSYVLTEECVIETIDKWANTEEKRKYLLDNGVVNESSKSILLRKLFVENKTVDFVANLSDSDIFAAIKFFSSAEGMNYPFVGDNQIKVLQNIRSRKNSPIKECTDTEKLYAESTEWNTSEYNLWREGHSISILLYKGEIPRYLEYNDKRLMLYREKNYCPDAQKHILYVNSLCNVDDLLFEIAREGNSGLNLDDYQELCRKGKITVSEETLKKKDEETQRLKEEIERLRHPNSSFAHVPRPDIIEQYSKIISDFMGGTFRLEEHRINAEHIVSSYRILQFIKSKGYTFATSFDEKEYVGNGKFNKIRLSNNIDIYPHGAQWKIWYLSVFEWNAINSGKAWSCLCVGLGEDDFVIIKSREDLDNYANSSNCVVARIQGKDGYSNSEVLDTLIPTNNESKGTVQIMIKVGDCPNKGLSSIFDDAFKSNEDNDYSL